MADQSESRLPTGTMAIRHWPQSSIISIQPATLIQVNDSDIHVRQHGCGHHQVTLIHYFDGFSTFLRFSVTWKAPVALRPVHWQMFRLDFL